MKRSLFRLLSGAAVVGYPVFVFVALRRFSPRVLAGALAGAMVVAWLVRARRDDPVSRAARPLIPALVVAAAAAATDDPRFLFALPVLISLALLWAFGRTLRAGHRPMIERIARTMDPEFPEEAVRHCRAVTQIWVGFFVVNAAIAGTLAVTGPPLWWAAYTGGIAYALMGAIFAGEFVVRKIRFPRSK